MRLRGFPTVEVPRKIHHEGNLLLSRFDIPHIEHPYLTSPIGICLRQLCGEEGRRQRTQPYPTVRVTMIRQVVIDACPTLASHFLWVTEVTAISMLVVRPQQRHVLRYLQPVMISIQHLLIGTQHLRYLLHRLMDIPTQHVPLVIDSLLHQGDTLMSTVGTLHRIVVNATQSEGIGILVSPIGLHTVLPVFLHRLAIGDIVEVTEGAGLFLFYRFPLPLIIT